MRFVFKTSYDADIRWFKHGAQMFWYLLLLAIMLALPLYFLAKGDAYLLGEFTSVLIFSVVGMGLMLLTGKPVWPASDMPRSWRWDAMPMCCSSMRASRG